MEQTPTSEVKISPPVLNRSDSSPAAGSEENSSGTQPEDKAHNQSPFDTPAPKTAVRKLSPKAKAKVESNLDRLLQLITLGGYTPEQFLIVAKKNKWVTESTMDLSSIPDQNFSEFLESDNLEIIMEELAKLPRHTKD